MSGLLGRNTKHYIGLQPDKSTIASDLLQLNAKSNSMEESVDTIQSEALTGNPVPEDADVSFIYPDGEVPAELTVNTLPKLLLLAGFEEPNTPTQVVTTLAADITSGDESFEPDSLVGMTPGTSVTIDDGTNTETVTVDYVEDPLVYIEESFSNEFVSGDDVQLDNKYLHTFKLAQAMSVWGTLIREKPTAGASGKYDVFEGVRINELGITAEQDAYIEVSPSVNGLDANIGQDGDVASAFSNINQAGEKILSLLSIIKLAGEDITADVDDANFTFNNNLLTDDKGLNQRKRRDLRRQDGMELTMELTTRFEASMYYDNKAKLKEGTYTDASIQFTRDMEFVFPKIMWTDVTAETGGPEDVTVSLSANIFWDNGVGTAVKVNVVDEQSTKYEAPTS